MVGSFLEFNKFESLFKVFRSKIGENYFEGFYFLFTANGKIVCDPLKTFED